MLRHTVFVGALALLVWPKSLIAAETSPADLVHIQRGTLPIILTAPHGGQAAVPGATIRSAENKGKDAWRFNTGARSRDRQNCARYCGSDQGSDGQGRLPGYCPL